MRFDVVSKTIAGQEHTMERQPKTNSARAACIAKHLLQRRHTTNHLGQMSHMDIASERTNATAVHAAENHMLCEGR